MCNFLQFWSGPTGFRILQITQPLSPQMAKMSLQNSILVVIQTVSNGWSSGQIMKYINLVKGHADRRQELFSGCMCWRKLRCWVRPCQWKEPKHLGRDLCVRYQGSKCGAPPYYPWDSFTHWMERYQADLQKSGKEGVIVDFIFNHIGTLDTYDIFWTLVKSFECFRCQDAQHL